MSVGQIKNSESLRGIEPQTFRFPRSGASPWATETPQWASLVYGTRPADG